MKIEITSENIIREIKRAEALSSWAKMPNEEKFNYFIGRASSEILDWHCRTFKDTRKVALTFEM